MESKLANQTVTSLLNEDQKKLVERNRSHLKIIADTLRLTAVQNIAQRRHRESNTDDDNLSNQEQLTFEFRYVFEYEVHEEFLGFINAEKLTAERMRERK